VFSLTIGLLLSLLVVAAWHDIRSRRIPNALVFSGAVAGILLNTLLPQQMGGLGVFDSLAGLGLGLVLLLPLYLLRAMGAGDVKLMAMTGAFLGANGVTGAFMCVLLAGGLLALAMGWHQGKLSTLLRKLSKRKVVPLTWGSPAELDSEETGSTVDPSRTATNLPKRTAKFDQLPYGVAIAVGTAAWIITVYS
jgi:prepilin peptidase CpaA